MPEHVNEWLSAYSDGELRGARLRQVENHLNECAHCRAELELLRNISSILQETAPAGNFLTTERFVSKLNLNLPRRPEKHQASKALELGWWLIPFGVLGVWAFLQITFTLSSLALNASNTGLLGSSFAWLQANPLQAEWFNTLTGLFGAQLRFNTALLTINNADLFIENLLGQVAWQALLALIYIGWLASWWFKQPDHVSTPGGMDIIAQ